MLRFFAQQIHAVDLHLESIRHKDTSPLDIHVEGYDAYESDEALVARVLDNRALRATASNLQQVSHSLERLRILADHMETLTALEKLKDPSIDSAILSGNQRLATESFDAVMAEYTTCVEKQHTAAEMEKRGIRGVGIASAQMLRARFQHAAEGNITEDIAALDKVSLFKIVGHTVADYASTILMMRAFEMTALAETANDHLLLYRRKDDGGMIDQDALDNDYKSLMLQATDTIDRARASLVRCRDIIDDGVTMRDEAVLRFVYLKPSP